MDEHFPAIIRQWLGKERSPGYEILDRSTSEAANICGASQKATSESKGREPVNRKERSQFNSIVKPLEEASLNTWARSNNSWIGEKEFQRQYASRQIGAGAEQRVYLHLNGRTVIKANKGNYHGNW